jgi:hypothetical protein
MPNRSSKVPAEFYPRTYRASGFWKIALYICSTLIAAGAVAGFIYSVVGQFYDLTGRILVGCLSLAFTALGGYTLLWLLRSKTVLYADRIDFHCVFSTKTFNRNELYDW